MAIERLVAILADHGARLIAAAWQECVLGTARVALTEVGAFGFYSDLYITDLVGLVDRETLAWSRERPARDRIRLDRLLRDRHAADDIDCDAQFIKTPEGSPKYETVMVASVARNISFSGAPTVAKWTIFRLPPADAANAKKLRGLRSVSQEIWDTWLNAWIEANIEDQEDRVTGRREVRGVSGARIADAPNGCRSRRHHRDRRGAALPCRATRRFPD